MWKTLGYQQLFRCFEKIAFLVDILHTGLHNLLILLFFVVLRHRCLPIFRLHFIAKKFTFCKLSMSNSVEHPGIPKFFCE